MKTLILYTIVCTILLTVAITRSIYCNYEWEKDYLQHWNLSDKSSTIDAKQKHISAFVEALEKGNTKRKFAENNAIFLKTLDNSFEANMTALKTLSTRLTEIQSMSPSSFEYNTAIQQITAQEQGEATAMIHTIKGCFVLENYMFIWGWIGATWVCLCLGGLVVGWFIVLIINVD